MTIQGIFNSLGQAVLDNLMVPIIVVFGAAFIAIIKPKVDKFVTTMVARADMDEIAKENTVRRDLIALIDERVQSAVASNMSIARAIKSTYGGVMPPEQGKALSDNAKKLVMNSLPVALTDEDGSLNKIIGGTDRLQAIIESSLEKHVYEYKYGPQGKEQEAQAIAHAHQEEHTPPLRKKSLYDLMK